MKILVLGDVMGLSGRKVLKKNLATVIKENEIDFQYLTAKMQPMMAREYTKK